jgi:glucans biosynthesis protein
MISRRHLLRSSIPWALAISGGISVPLATARELRFGEPQPFDFDRLVAFAKTRASRAYQTPPRPGGDFLDRIDFDAIQEISYRPDHALWHERLDRLPVRFFHMHRFVRAPVRMHVVSDGMSREMEYSPELFDYGDSSLAQGLPEDLGFAGFRVMDSQQGDTDWLAFQGASYFRSSGASRQYGASARAIAANTATESKEEFPAFTQFWFDSAGSSPNGITIHALLEGPSLTGAYRIRAVRDQGVTTDVHATLFIRRAIARLGIAPLTSMYWYGENHRREAYDWRPEIHDNDGLALWTGSGERIFRPLVNPPVVQVNSFVDDNPKGFGLVQRDRNFDHYQDDGAFYDRRPSIWVEPLGEWGKGAVQLVEIPTDDEIHDNIVAFWKPQKPVSDGNSLTLDYRLHWQDRQPYPPDNVAQVIATRTGRAGIPGQPRTAEDGAKFVIDFQGGPLDGMEARYDVVPEVTVSRGTVTNAYVIKVVDTRYWRAAFDVKTNDKDPVDLRCFLRLGDKTLSETWLYQFFPPA